MKSKAILMTMMFSLIAMIPLSGCIGGEEVTIEYDITCQTEGYMSAQINGQEAWPIDEYCQVGYTLVGRGTWTATEAGDVFQIVYLQENAYACEVVISKYHIQNGYAFCED
tara:strand:- start:48 stop:380 length:333 start_codon:yes stop_codon:yes gene_type:complete